MVILGYGECKGYRIEQVPETILRELAARFKLSYRAQLGSSYEDLQITIAIHEEVHRREAGGAIMAREPSPRELAKQLVARGYRSLSRDHHPDVKGGSGTAQKRLNDVREALLKVCDQLDDEYPEGALVIHALEVLDGPEISDEDIPF